MLQELQQRFTREGARNAFCIQDVFYSYEAFGREIERTLGLIQDAGGSETGRVGIVATNTIQTYASIFACWFSGYAYIPINPTFPEDRNLSVTEQAGIDLFLTSDASLINGAVFTANRRVIQTTSLSRSQVSLPDLALDFSGEDRLLYILFTSGSTGTPKGVPISSENIQAFLQSYHDLGFTCSDEDRFLQMFDLTFDVSVASFLVPLLLGACVYTVPSSGIKYMAVYKIMRDHEITFASVVPSVINFLRPYLAEIQLKRLKYCILTAEASNVEMIRIWKQCIPNAEIWNLYGPTEATIWCTGYRVDNDQPKAYHNMLAIGKPFSQVTASIRDEAGRRLGQGEKGELCVISKQLTQGYLNDPVKTDKQFCKSSDGIYYKTGDLCFVDEDGDIIYCGRADHQVKISGFRIELSEIEVVMTRLYQVNSVAVSYKTDSGTDQICLFVEDESLDPATLKKVLGEHLPYYMVPAMIRTIAQLPLNTSGKIDRPKLVSQCRV